MKIKLAGAVVVFASTALLATGCAGQDDDAANPAAPATSAAQATSAAPAGNGVEALEAQQILDKAKAALKKAGSFHMKGDIVTDGSKMGLDFKTGNGEVIGKLSMGGPSVELLEVAKKRYIRPDAAFWSMSGGGKEQGEQMAKLVGDRWVAVKATDKNTADMFGFSDIDSMLNADGKVTKGAAKDINGRPAIGLVDNSQDGGTLYIATTGEPYPLRIESKNAAEGGLDFTEFGEKFPDIKAPAPADVVDIEKLMGK
ncbi:hypothetical protein [Actinoplanes sp. M2I2]|uniref:hypothetical protein n=1 Tax=Actinoplanes sp. M2I2 TaxID=1734444 RepID=UPI002020884F|nr:hypothetical protein [Actinoplanes sp. M2I2]